MSWCPSTIVVRCPPGSNSPETAQHARVCLCVSFVFLVDHLADVSTSIYAGNTSHVQFPDHTAKKPFERNERCLAASKSCLAKDTFMCPNKSDTILVYCSLVVVVLWLQNPECSGHARRAFRKPGKTWKTQGRRHQAQLC